MTATLSGANGGSTPSQGLMITGWLTVRDADDVMGIGALPMHARLEARAEMQGTATVVVWLPEWLIEDRGIGDICRGGIISPSAVAEYTDDSLIIRDYRLDSPVYVPQSQVLVIQLAAMVTGQLTLSDASRGRSRVRLPDEVSGQ